MKHRNLYGLVVLAAIFSSCTDIHKAPERPKVPTDTAAETETRLMTGEKIFEAKCVACHGNDGTAGIANAANLQTSQLSNAAIVNTVSNGRGGMPSFKSQLSEGDIQDLANYVITLRK